MNNLQKYLSTCLLATAALLVGASPAWAQVTLGKASGFAVLSAAPGGGGAVTCTDSTINGDVGSSGAPASVTQNNCTINGAIVAPVSAQVVSDFNKAYGKYTDANFPCTGMLDTAYTGVTVTLTPGVYCNTAAVTFTDSTLILKGDANAVWIFRIGTGGTGALTGTNFTVVMEDGGEPCNVTWWVAEAVTMTTSGFQGTILAGAAITMSGLAGSAGSIAPFNGNALAKAAVTLTDVTVNGCTGGSRGGKSRSACNQGIGNGPEGCDPGKSTLDPFRRSNDELGGAPRDPGPSRKGGNK